MNAGLDGRRPPGLTWNSVAEYLDLYDRSVPVNVAYVIGNTPLRVASVGWYDTKLTAEDMAAQRQLLQEGLDQGAFGFSTGLTYPPGSFAEIDELAELAEVATRRSPRRTASSMSSLAWSRRPGRKVCRCRSTPIPTTRVARGRW